MIMEIKSKENEKIKYAKSLLKSKKRGEEKKYIIEGYRILKQALECNTSMEYVLFTEDFLNKEEQKEFILFLQNKEIKLYKVEKKLFKEIADTENPQGILGIVKYNEYKIEDIYDQDANFLLILDRIQDPGNMGTIIRSADAAGVDRIILLKGCVDVYNLKVIRSTMGSIFSMPIIEVEDENECIDNLKKKGFNIVSSYLNTDHYYHKVEYKDKVALVIGNEGNGIKEEIIEKSDTLVKIPIYGKAESLNAAMAAGILMYEIKNNLDRCTF